MMVDNSSGGKMILISGMICDALLGLKSVASRFSGVCGIGCVFGGDGGGGGGGGKDLGNGGEGLDSNDVEVLEPLDTAGWLCCWHVFVW